MAVAELCVEGNAADVGTEEPKVDLHLRDPEHINYDVRVTFSEIFAEPEPSLYSFDKIWIYSGTVFTTTKLWCYRITSLIFALPLMVLWGIYFACLSFFTIWCCVPCFKAYDIKLHCIRRLWGSFIQTFMEPCYLAIGKIFYNIRITKD